MIETLNIVLYLFYYIDIDNFNLLFRFENFKLNLLFKKKKKKTKRINNEN